MRRRDFIAAAASTVALPLATTADTEDRDGARIRFYTMDLTGAYNPASQTYGPDYKALILLATCQDGTLLGVREKVKPPPWNTGALEDEKHLLSELYALGQAAMNADYAIWRISDGKILAALTEERLAYYGRFGTVYLITEGGV